MSTGVDTGRHRAGFVLSVAFFAGIIATLVSLGTAAAYVGQVLRQWEAGFTIGIAVISLAAGVITLAGPRLRHRHDAKPHVRRWGVPGAFVYGIVYSFAAVTTSAGPLMLLLTLSAAVGRPGWGALLSLAYAIGRGLPFVFIGVFADAAARFLARVRNSQKVIKVFSVVALFAAAAYFGWAGVSMLNAG